MHAHFKPSLAFKENGFGVEMSAIRHLNTLCIYTIAHF